MITWGISANSHDAALAVFDNKRLVFASHSERFSRVKNDGDLHADLINYAVDQWGSPNEIVWYERPRLKTLRQLIAGQGLRWNENDIPKYLSKYINTEYVDIKYSQHHHSHAAAGYYTSKFDNATVVVIDAIGEFESLTIWQAKKNQLKKVYSQSYPHSIGLWYSAMTDRIGLKANEEEYILMGMAALGDPIKYGPRIFNDFFELKNRSIKLKHNLHRGCRWWLPQLDSEQDRRDIAAGTQWAYELVFQQILEIACEITDSRNLVLMGGCALNCVANVNAYRYFSNVWIMPNPGDAGSAVGAVLAKWQTKIDWPGAYLGYDMGYRDSNEQIVDHLIEHKICGLARGPAEYGPRALGNRSLLGDPRGPEVKPRMNVIKKREEFRPFAPAVLAEHAHLIFAMPCDHTPYMQYAVECYKPELYPGIVHYDGTSRVQTVTKKDNPEFRKLLELWFERTGCPMLVNTSLNIKGEPIVNTHEDADRWEQRYGITIFR